MDPIENNPAQPNLTRTQQCAIALDSLLREYNCSIAGIPKFAPDGRGGWYLTVSLEMIENGKAT